MMKIIFSHGKESGPNGRKIRLLSETAKNMGFDTESVDYRGIDDVNDRVKLLERKIIASDGIGIILVGSSMGGYVSTVIASKYMIKGLFLLCPALYMGNYEFQDYPVTSEHITIVHGYNDEIIPFENSIRFGTSHSANILLLPDNHRLSNSHAILAEQFHLFLKNMS